MKLRIVATALSIAYLNVCGWAQMPGLTYNTANHKSLFGITTPVKEYPGNLWSIEASGAGTAEEAWLGFGIGYSHRISTTTLKAVLGIVTRVDGSIEDKPLGVYALIGVKL